MKTASPATHLNANGVHAAIGYPAAPPLLQARARFGPMVAQFPHAYGDQNSNLRQNPAQQGSVIRLLREFARRWASVWRAQIY